MTPVPRCGTFSSKYSTIKNIPIVVSIINGPTFQSVDIVLCPSNSFEAIRQWTFIQTCPETNNGCPDPPYVRGFTKLH